MQIKKIFILFIIVNYLSCSISEEPVFTWVDPPQSVSFNDDDRYIRMIGGVVTILKAANEYNIDFYSLYLGTSGNEKAELIAEIPSTGGDISYTLPSNTPLRNYTQFTVATRNDEYISTGSVSTLITDYIGSPPENCAQKISFTDVDPEAGQISGIVEITRAKIENGFDYYCLYYANSNHSELTLIQEIRKPENENYVLPISILIPKDTPLGDKSYFFVKTKIDDQISANRTEFLITDRIFNDDITPPGINSINFPATITESFTGTAIITDNIEMGDVRAVVNGNTIISVNIGSDYTFNIAYSALDIGDNTIRIVAFDAVGNEMTQDVVVQKIDNVAPVIGSSVIAIFINLPNRLPGPNGPPPPQFDGIRTTLNNVTDNDSISQVILASGSVITLDIFSGIQEQYVNVYQVEMIKGDSNSYYIMATVPKGSFGTGNIQLSITAIDLADNWSTRYFNINF